MDDTSVNPAYPTFYLGTEDNPKLVYFLEQSSILVFSTESKQET